MKATRWTSYPLRAAAWLVLVLLVAGISALGAEDKKEEKQPAPTPSAEEVAVGNITTAYDLVEYGRRVKSPLALITAAEMLGKVITKEFKEKPMIDGKEATDGIVNCKKEAAALVAGYRFC